MVSNDDRIRLAEAARQYILSTLTFDDCHKGFLEDYWPRGMECDDAELIEVAETTLATLIYRVRAAAAYVLEAPG
jgi:hypothetical protein